MSDDRKDPLPTSADGASVGTANELLLAGAEMWQVLERMVRQRADLSLNQFNALRVLVAREPEPAHASDLIRALSMSSAHATTVLQQLEHRGLVERSENPHDRRRRAVRLTGDGRAALDRARPALVLLEERVLGARAPQSDPAMLRGELRSIRLALRQALAVDDLDCVGP